VKFPRASPLISPLRENRTANAVRDGNGRSVRGKNLQSRVPGSEYVDYFGKAASRILKGPVVSRRDKENRAKFWVDRDLGGVGLLRAAFGTMSFPRHVHSEFVIAVTEEGAGRCVTRGVSDVGTSRSIMVFNPGEPHAGGVSGNTTWRYRGLYITEAMLRDICENVGARPVPTPYFNDSVVKDAQLADLLVRAHRALEVRDARLTRESLFLAGIARLMERHGEPRPPSPNAGNERDPVRRALDYMQSNLACDLSISELAACAGLSPFHFVRCFRKANGLPPHACLTQLRLNRARLLLAEGKSPAEVALSVGFYDQSHLIKHFKRTYGITPGQYAAALA
jgi:AraC-like DNA-binding protein